MSQQLNLSAEVTDEQLGFRLDQALASLFPDYSRSRIKEWILAEMVKVDGQLATRPREKVYTGQTVEVDATEDVVDYSVARYRVIGRLEEINAVVIVC